MSRIQPQGSHRAPHPSYRQLRVKDLPKASGGQRWSRTSDLPTEGTDNHHSTNHVPIFIHLFIHLSIHSLIHPFIQKFILHLLKVTSKKRSQNPVRQNVRSSSDHKLYQHMIYCTEQAQLLRETILVNPIIAEQTPTNQVRLLIRLRRKNSV